MTLPPPPPLDVQHALFLDFDGTLAPLGPDADAVRLTREKMRILSGLSKARGGALALVSGRDVRDLASRTPTDVVRIGNHGLFRMDAGEKSAPSLPDMPADLDRKMRAIADQFDGAFLEVKGPVGTLHYRACSEAGPQIMEMVKTTIATVRGYRTKFGNHVAEALPDSASKGVALENAMKAEPFLGRIPVMIGDDTTDEEGFLAAQRAGGFGIKVGQGGPSETVARKYLPDVDAVWDWLEGRERTDKE